MSPRRVIEMPPPPVVQRRIDDFRDLQPPMSLLDDVLREIEEEPQQTSGVRRAVGVAGALAVAAAALLTAILLFQNANVGNNASPSPSSSASAAGGLPVPIDELPVAGGLDATIPIAQFDILTLGAFDSVWLANPGEGTVSRVDPVTNEVADRFEVRPADGGFRMWLAATSDLLWVGTGGTRSLVALDPATGEVQAEVDLGVDPFTLAADATEVWLTDYERGLVIGVDATTGAEIHRVEVAGPTGISIGATSIWVASTDSNAAVEIDRASGEILRRIQTGPTPLQVSVDPSGVDVFVLGRDGMPITAIDVASGQVRRGTKELTALTFVDGVPWGLLPSGLFLGPLDRQTLEFTAGLSLPTPSGEGLIFASGSLWTTDVAQLYRVRPGIG